MKHRLISTGLQVEIGNEVTQGRERPLSRRVIKFFENLELSEVARFHAAINQGGTTSIHAHSSLNG